jgi:hypothetical protein
MAALAVAVVCPWGFGCAPAVPAASPSAARVQRSEPVSFSFTGMNQEAVTSETTRGRATLLAFITTYDLPSQMLVRRVGELIVRFTPRANAAAVVMEPPLYAELLPTYSSALSLPFPVVMADFQTLQGRGHFGGIQNVPTVVVLDREGREVWRRQGPLDADEIEAALRLAL